LAQRSLFGRVFLALAILSAANVAIAVFFALYLQVGYFSEKSIARIISDLAFVEGSTSLFVGAILAFFRPSVSRLAKVLMVVGVSMIVISVGFGAFA
jgi:hypothetical protein